MSPKTILAVDDENDILLCIRVALEDEGYEVATAANGVEALAQVERNVPDLIVTDVMMPEMSGFELLERLMSDERTSGVPVVMLTVVDQREQIMQALDKGVASYVTKPFEAKDLAIAVNEALSRSDAGGLTF